MFQYNVSVFPYLFPPNLFYLCCFLDSGKSNTVFILYFFSDEFLRYELLNDDVILHTNVMFI